MRRRAAAADEVTMDNVVLELSPEATINIEAVGGDLRVVGWEQSGFTAESDDDNTLHVQNRDNTLFFRADSDCTVRLPYSRASWWAGWAATRASRP
jgi:hypothetical protein